MANESDRARESSRAQWSRGMHGPALARRTAQSNAAFFLEHLQPGMTLLDAGCGPGSITLGLAEAVAPGHVTGIDISGEAIDAARALAAERGATNVEFRGRDVMALPFEDASFDAVFAHALLQHLAEPQGAVRELCRVLRPGGVIGVADADFGSSIIFPEHPLIDRSFELMARTRRHPYVGRRLRQLLADAGCIDITGTVAGVPVGSDDAVRGTGEWQAAYFEGEPFVEQAVAEGRATREEMAGMAREWRRWGESPGAFWARFWCQAVGRAP